MDNQESKIISPENMGTWVAVGFILALLAIGVGSISLYRLNVVNAAAQMEILSLNKRIVDLERQRPAPQAPAAAEKK